MAIIVIKEGKEKKEKKVNVICIDCRSELQFIFTDATVKRYGSSLEYHIRCPVCREINSWTVEEYDALDWKD